MASWDDLERWWRLTSGEACPFCVQGRPNGVVAELEGCYLTVDANVRVRGYCCLVVRRHAVEFDELSEAEAIGLVRDLRQVARVLRRITGAVKLNYEVHGNTIPHLHVHLIPRYRGDELEESGKTLATLTRAAPTAAEHERFIAALASAIAAGG